MSSVVKLVPTSSLKVKVKVTSPLAVVPLTLLETATVGGVVSVTTTGVVVSGAVASPPPQADSSTAIDSDRADSVRCLGVLRGVCLGLDVCVVVVMAVSPCGWKVNSGRRSGSGRC